MNLPVFDLHCDTALELLDSQCRPAGRLAKRRGHIDLERGKALKGYAQLFAIFTTPGMDPSGRFSPEEVTGKTVIIHGMRDDFSAQPSGDSGEKIACGRLIRNDWN